MVEEELMAGFEDGYEWRKYTGTLHH